MNKEPIFFDNVDSFFLENESIRDIINSKRPSEKKSEELTKKQDSIAILKLKMDDIEKSIIQLNKEFSNSSEEIKNFIDIIKEKYGSNNSQSETSKNINEPNEKVYSASIDD